MEKVFTIIVAICIIVSGALIIYKLNEPPENESFIQSIFIHNASGEYILFPDIVDENNERAIELSDIQVINGSCQISRIQAQGINFLKISCDTVNVTLLVNLTKMPDNWSALNYSGTEHYFEIPWETIPVYYSGNNTAYLGSLWYLEYGEDNRQTSFWAENAQTGWNDIQVQTYYNGNFIPY